MGVAVCVDVWGAAGTDVGVAVGVVVGVDVWGAAGTDVGVAVGVVVGVDVGDAVGTDVGVAEGVAVSVGVGDSVAKGANAGVELVRAPAAGEGSGSSRQPARSITRSITLATRQLVEDFDTVASMAICQRLRAVAQYLKIWPQSTRRPSPIERSGGQNGLDYRYRTNLKTNVLDLVHFGGPEKARTDHSGRGGSPNHNSKTVLSIVKIGPPATPARGLERRSGSIDCFPAVRVPLSLGPGGRTWRAVYPTHTSCSSLRIRASCSLSDGTPPFD